MLEKQVFIVLKENKDGAANNDATANDKLDSSSGKNQLIRGL